MWIRAFLTWVDEEIYCGSSQRERKNGDQERRTRRKRRKETNTKKHQINTNKHQKIPEKKDKNAYNIKMGTKSQGHEGKEGEKKIQKTLKKTKNNKTETKRINRKSGREINIKSTKRILKNSNRYQKNWKSKIKSRKIPKSSQLPLNCFLKHPILYSSTVLPFIISFDLFQGTDKKPSDISCLTVSH